MGLKPNLKVVGYSHNVEATIALVYICMCAQKVSCSCSLQDSQPDKTIDYFSPLLVYRVFFSFIQFAYNL